jgi:lipopolysaccharide transport system ATP-binding protein
MYVRLAFAVAAYLDPELLLVDEVLAVGDAEFQQKCLKKIGDVAKGGRTVLFVSHNLGAVKSLCNRCLLIEKGRLQCDDEPSAAIDAYLARVYSEKSTKRSGVPIQVRRIFFEDASGRQASGIQMGGDAILRIDYVIEKKLNDVTIAVLISKQESPLLYTYDTDMDSTLRGARSAGSYTSRVCLPTSLLKEGTYVVAVLIGCGRENLTDANAYVALDIVNHDRDLTHRSYRRDRPGFLYREIKWDTEMQPRESPDDGDQ